MKTTSILIALLTICLLNGAEPEKITPFYCVDGDTFLAAPDSINYRLWGVDAPEHDQPWGHVAKAVLEQMLIKKRVTIEHKGESYKRPVVLVTFGKRDVGLELLKMGLAWHDTRFAPHRQDYAAAQEDAKKAKRGLWMEKKPIPPWEHRANRKYEIEDPTD